MQAPRIAEQETNRIAALHSLNILDTPIEAPFERITRLAKGIYNVPIVAFSLVDLNRQWFKSIQGLSVCETSREVSFCGHAINQDGIFIIQDAAIDPRFADNPLVTGEPHIRFYMGYPVLATGGWKIGTLCLIDRKPRQFNSDEMMPLVDLAALVESEINYRKLITHHNILIDELNTSKMNAHIDKLTRLWNRSGIEDLLNHKIQHAIAKKRCFGLALIDVDNFKKINDLYGHCAGDTVLQVIARRLLSGYRDNDIVGRWGGEEFLAIFDIDDNASLRRIAERARIHISGAPILIDHHKLNVTVTTGVSLFDYRHPSELTMLVNKADVLLYQGKRQGKNVVILLPQVESVTS